MTCRAALSPEKSREYTDQSDQVACFIRQSFCCPVQKLPTQTTHNATETTTPQAPRGSLQAQQCPHSHHPPHPHRRPKTKLRPPHGTPPRPRSPGHDPLQILDAHRPSLPNRHGRLHPRNLQLPKAKFVSGDQYNVLVTHQPRRERNFGRRGVFCE